MVFESIVVELINRYLGEFVENLDKSQMKIGIWGGDVVLKNLNLKESALDELDLPVKIKAGHIAKLTLKIPWKNLYTEPVVAEIDGIYALAVPNIGIVYNEEKEKKAQQEAKQAKLDQIEEQKKLAQEKGKPKDPKKDSFGEKLATQIIKNLQVKVSSVHVRYEDSYSNPACPVAIGVTLGQLLFQTTDENWKETVIKQAVTEIHKLIRMDNLAVYWSSHADMMQSQPNNDILQSLDIPKDAYLPNEDDKDDDDDNLNDEIDDNEGMKAKISRHGNKLNLPYLFKPISAVAHLKLNTKPELGKFTTPKIFLSLVFDNIALSLTKQQYDNILQLMESQERMNLMALNKKTRPDGSYKGNYKKWWHHAYSRILENQVQRRRRIWSWQYIRSHRQNLKQYKDLYVKKLDKKISSSEDQILKELEEKLDVLNIMMSRTQAERIITLQGAKKAEEKAQNPGWFSGWFGSKKNEGSVDSQQFSSGAFGNLGEEFQKEFNQKEQEKLYNAIGYEEGVADTTFPTEYVAVRVVTKLNKLSVSLIDDSVKTRKEVVLKSTLSEIFASFGQRPSANAIRIDSKVGRLLVTGHPWGPKDTVPKVVTSVNDEEASLLSVMFEVNPISGDCDSRARVKSNPLEIIYDATTINSMATFFKPPEDIRLKQFSEAAMARYTIIKEQTANGMLHAMEEKKYMDLEVDLMASYILVPATGQLKKDVNMLMLNLGSLKISSEQNRTAGLEIAKMTKEEIKELAYDKFNISLTDVQLLFVQPGDMLQDPQRTNKSPLYVLRPLSLAIGLEKCIFSKDPTLPQMRISGELPLVSVALSDTKLIGIMKLVQSIPVPETGEQPEEEFVGSVDTTRVSTVGEEVELSRLALKSNKLEDTRTSEFTNFTTLSMTFHIHEVCLELFETVEDKEIPLIKFVAERIGMEMRMRTFDMLVDAYLGGIYLQHLQYKLTPGMIEQLKKCDVLSGEVINIINTPKQTDDTPLLAINFLQANKKGPEFSTVYKNTAQSITAQFATLDFIIHQQVIISIMKFAKKFESAPVEEKRFTRRLSTTSSITSIGAKLKEQKRASAADSKGDVIQLKLRGHVEGIRVGLCNEVHVIMDANVGGIEAGLSIYKDKMGINAIIRKVDVVDPDPHTLHKHIMTVSGSNVMSFNMIQYNDGTKDSKFDDPKNVDLDIKVTLGRAKVRFVNKFVSSLVNFLDNFAVAKEKLVEAKKAAEEASKDVAKNIAEHASRIKLSVTLNAPLIIFPRNSKSPEVIMINLGDIVLQNRFEKLGSQKNKPGMAHIAEAMSLTLTNLRLSRGISHDSVVKVEINILEPISFKVNLKRNLSEGWYHGIPDLSVSAVLDSIKVSLSFEDMCMIMMALDENLGERARVTARPDRSPEVPTDNDDIVDAINFQSKDRYSQSDFSKTASFSKKLEPVKEDEGPVLVLSYTKIKLDFKMGTLDLCLYKGSSDLDKPRTPMVRQVDKKLAQICVNHLDVDLSMKSDQAMSSTISLGEILLNDMRKEKQGGITEMIKPINGHQMFSNTSDQRLMKVEYNQSHELDRVLNLHIYSIHVCVCIEFLMRVVEFFTKAIPDAKPKTIEQAKEEQMMQLNDYEKTHAYIYQYRPKKKRLSQCPCCPLFDSEHDKNGSTGEVTPTVSKPTVQPSQPMLVDNQAVQEVKKEESPIGTMNITLKLEKPEIILIEDQMNALTNSLIVDVMVNFNLRTNEDNDQMVNASIENLSLISCIYKQPETGKSVLSPCDINLFSKAPGGKNHHVDISVSDLIINISPSTIRLLSGVTAGLVATPENQVMETILEDHSNIWLAKDLNQCSFWFTNEAVTSNVVKPVVDSDKTVQIERGEELMMSAPTMIIKLEGGIGHRTVPLLILESAFSAQVQDWSSKLHVESCLKMEVAYYNETRGAWEPIIEPITCPHSKDVQQWEIELEVNQNEDFVPTEEFEELPLPKMEISLVARQPLQLVVTKTCLEVLNHLGKVFNEAYLLQEMEGYVGEKLIPFIFKNESGMDMKLLLNTSFEIAAESQCKDANLLKSGESLSVSNKKGKTLTSQTSVIRDSLLHTDRHIAFQVLNWADTVKFEAAIKKSGRKMYTLPSKDQNGEQMRIVCNVESTIGQKTITFSSLLKVYNCLEYPVTTFYKDSNSKLVSCGTVDPLHSLWLPLAAVYSTDPNIYFQPLSKEDEHKPIFNCSQNTLDWKDSEIIGKVKQMTCDPLTPGNSSFYFNVLPKVTHIPIDRTEGEMGNIITFHLQPTVMLHNLLPYDIKFLLEGTAESTVLKAGRYTALDHASVDQSTLELVIPDYQHLEWVGRKLIKMDATPLSVWTFTTTEQGKSIHMDLGVHSKVNEGSLDLTIYSPYWIINMSQKQLSIQEDDKETPFVQPADTKDVMMFYFKDKPLFGSTKKRQVHLKIGDQTEWSDKFSLDTVGSSGNVICKNKADGTQLEVGVQINLSASGLTKIVTFTPFYMMLNASLVPIKVREETLENWMDVQPGECKPFYPETPAKNKTVKMVAQLKGSELITTPFLVNKAHTTLLKLTDKFGGLNADCQVRESAMITTFSLYKIGMATVQIVNQSSDLVVSFHQSGLPDKKVDLQPMTSVLYTWDDPCGKLDLMWSCEAKKNVKGKIEMDGVEVFQAKKGEDMYWVSFLDGMQRVLMFTPEHALALMANGAGQLEQANTGIKLGIHDFGLSLVNNDKFVELAYMGITNSGVIWEEKKKRYKAMKVKDNLALEHGYQKYLMEKETGKKRSSVYSLDNKLEVDFDKMEMMKPRSVHIRRSFEDGIWLDLKVSKRSKQFHAKINRLQLDNQLRHAVFPTILSPMPPPKSVAADSVPKPFVELSLIMNIQEHSSLVQIKYFRVLIQEMNLKVDQGFLNAILAFFDSGAVIDRDEEFSQFEEDINRSGRNLKEEAGLSIQQAQPNFYDSFHISPIKIHLSFSLQGGDSGTAIQSEVLNVFLQSVGVVLTDVQDVVFKLGYFERNHTFYDGKNLTNEFIRHYSGQAIKQMYVLILGLDVLGNPFGLLRGLGEGIEDLFYEPYQGAIQGPEEFAEGLALGVRSLFGHAVGGAAGAVSRITGTVGKGLAALTLDDDYQKKRREQMNKRPASAKEGFARGGKGLVMGVFDGVTGIVRKPVEGAKQEGVSGFFKGMGKGLVGVVTRPTSGVVDFASSSFEGIRRITDMSEEIQRLRPPRRFQKDGIVRPYIQEEAEGYYLLGECEKGKFIDTDEYLLHVNLKTDGKLVLIITDKRVILSKRGEIFGSWDTEWVLTYEEIKATPKQTSKGLEIQLKDDKKKKLFGGPVGKRDVHISDPKVVKLVIDTVTKAMDDLSSQNGM